LAWSASAPAPYSAVKSELLRGCARLIVLQLKTSQVESRIARLWMRRDVLHKDLLCLLPIAGVLQRGAQFVQRSFVTWMQGERVPQGDDGLLILPLQGQRRSQVIQVT
jgi:hypothetical protein